jgi:hypothetical protein
MLRLHPTKLTNSSRTFAKLVRGRNTQEVKTNISCDSENSTYIEKEQMQRSLCRVNRMQIVVPVLVIEAHPPNARRYVFRMIGCGGLETRNCVTAVFNGRASVLLLAR